MLVHPDTRTVAMEVGICECTSFTNVRRSAARVSQKKCCLIVISVASRPRSRPLYEDGRINVGKFRCGCCQELFSQRAYRWISSNEEGRQLLKYSKTSLIAHRPETDFTCNKWGYAISEVYHTAKNVIRVWRVQCVDSYKRLEFLTHCTSYTLQITVPVRLKYTSENRCHAN